MRNQPGIVNGLVTMGAVALLLVWGVTALTNEDPLWFLNRFDAQAASFTVYWDGEIHTILPDDPGYAPIMEAFARGVARPTGFEGEIGLSEESIANYHERFRLLEVTFPESIQIHTRHPYPEARTYLVPLNETHARWHRVFAFSGLLPYTSGPLDIDGHAFDALYRSVEAAVTSGAE